MRTHSIIRPSSINAVVVPILAFALTACVPQGRSTKLDDSLNYDHFLVNGIIFAGMPSLKFPFSGLPDDYSLDTTELNRVLSEEFDTDNIVGPLRLRKLIGRSQYRQVMIAAARDGLPHWSLLDEISKHFPYHNFMIMLAPATVNEFKHHLIVKTDAGRGIQTISELRGSMRVLVVNMHGLKKLSMDAVFKHSVTNSRVLTEDNHREVRKALTKPVLEIPTRWYPPYPKKSDLYRGIVRDFIEVLKNNY